MRVLTPLWVRSLQRFVVNLTSPSDSFDSFRLRALAAESVSVIRVRNILEDRF
jgi:hypothetical protein